MAMWLHLDVAGAASARGEGCGGERFGQNERLSQIEGRAASVSSGKRQALARRACAALRRRVSSGPPRYMHMRAPRCYSDIEVAEQGRRAHASDTAIAVTPAELHAESRRARTYAQAQRGVAGSRTSDLAKKLTTMCTC
jgi:hypothetical protein